MTYFPAHLVVATAALVATLGLSAFTANTLVRRKLRLSVFLLGAYLLARVVMWAQPDLAPLAGSDYYAFEELALAAALINLFVVALLNPLRADGIPDRFPSIVQDAFVIGLLVLVSTFAFGDKLLATSAVGAVVIGFALQDTLGNAFAGLAIQSEKPFRVGHWVRIGDHEGRITEVTWRATRLRTKTGNYVVLPNSEVGKAPITNYSEPVAPTRLSVEVGVSYDAPPNRVKGVILDALKDCPLVLGSPAARVLLVSFDDSSVRYQVQFWVQDYETDEAAWDQVRTSIYYAFRRHGIEIPYPIAVEIGREDKPVDVQALARQREAVLERLELFAPLAAEERRGLAEATRLLTYGDGQVIVREGDPGDSMYVVVSGAVAVRIRNAPNDVAVTEAGGYFGEMSLLTGEPRSATVVAKGDATVLEITASAFREVAQVSPETVEQIGLAAASRRVVLEEVRASARATDVGTAPATFLNRMRRFLRIR